MKYTHNKILANSELAPGIFSMKIEAHNAQVIPGQFYMLKPDGQLLGRPISICEAASEHLEFCYAVVGEGTRELSRLRPGDEIPLTGPLGNGFDMDYINSKGRVAIVSGSIGIAPFVELTKHLICEYRCFCGFHGDSYLTDRLKNAAVATETGSTGHKGLVTDLFDPADYDLVLICGSEGMLKAVVKLCVQKGVEVLASLDKHMACGVGACLCCTCKTVKGNKRCCVDGPVFSGGDLIW